MKLIKLSYRKEDLFAMVDDADYEFLAAHRWHANNSPPYAVRQSKGRHIAMHREIMNPPADLVVDHIDGNRLNNQRSNLRIVTRYENSQNLVYHRLNPLGRDRIKTAKFRVQLAQIICPLCSKPINGGELLFDKSSYEQLPSVIVCVCGGKVRKPRINF